MNIRKLADAFAAELIENLDQSERDAVREGRAVPCDFYDSNDSMMRAWTTAFGDDVFVDDHIPEDRINTINAAAAIAHKEI